jgi:uncharacterized membrane protein YhaH (DUF805 family)
MNDAPQEIWYYSRDGERLGPVSFTDLRNLAAEATLNPRLDLAWTKGMAEWKPSGEIAGLFERNSASTPPELLAPAPVATPAPAAPYQPPLADPADLSPGNEITWPGARRRSFLFMTLIFPALFTEGFSYGLPFLAPHLTPQMNQYIMFGCMLVPAILAICYSLMRLTNLGMSRWWFFANLVPFLNIWLGYRTFACPAGYAYHKKLDGVGIFLAIVYWLLLAIGILMVVLIVAALAGALGSPEYRQQIQEFLQKAGER